MIGGLDFLWDFNNFPIDDELINNFRTRHPGGRTRPTRTTSSQLRPRAAVPHQRVRGRPAEPPRRDRRTRASRAKSSAGRAATASSRRCTRRTGSSVRPTSTGRPTATTGSASAASSPGTTSRYWSTELTSQFFADAYKEKPIRWNAFAEDRLDLGDVVVVGGVRYDWYDSRASRPNGFPVDLDPSRLRSGQPDGPSSSGTRATTTSARTCRCRSR